MAKAWVTDLWVKDATLQLADGTTAKVSPTPAQLKAITKLPEQFRTSKFGTGKRWRVTWHENVDGAVKPKSRAFDRRTGPAGADAFAAAMDEDIRVGRYIDPDNTDRTFAEVAEAWMQAKRRISDTSYIEYRNKLDRYVLPKWGTRKIGSIKRQEIDEWVTELLQGTAPFAFKNASGETSNQPKPQGHSSLTSIVRTVFGGAFKYALGERWIAESPMARVELPKAPAKQRRGTLTHQEVEDFAQECRNVSGEYRDYVAIHLLAYSAPRIGEAFALQKHHLQLPTLRARIEQTWKLSRDGGRVLGPPKNGESRTVPVIDHVAPMLETLTEDIPEDGWVFRQVRVDNALWSHNWVPRVWTPAAERLGFFKRFVKFTPHTLRHTAITFAIAAGADIKVVQALAGHRSANMTLDLYGHLFPDKLDQVRTQMAEHRAASVRPVLRAIS